jgi:hypothetical protein
MLDEIPLRGGRVTHGVVRVGDTVHRPATANSEFVARLLQHLALQGFAGAPAPLGTEELGRDVLASPSLLATCRRNLAFTATKRCAKRPP